MERQQMLTHKCTSYLWHLINERKLLHNELASKRENMKLLYEETLKKQTDESMMLRFVLLIIFILSLFQWYDSLIHPRLPLFKAYLNNIVDFLQ